jgi:DNA mismatch repair protein MutS2
VLAALTELVGTCAVGMLQNIDVAARLDVIFARGRFAVKNDCVMPEIADEIYLQQARHPLLGANAVPIDVTLGEDNRRVMLITGPNTGGKTVTLKTVGLMAMMAQSGLHIPAEEGSRLPIFTGAFADIGDEQSIEQNLSTFSGHMTAIIRILKDAQKGALVLFDELGAGTDPTEGAALAKVILTELYDRGCTVIATTHYGELKVYAQSAPGFLNASVEFDLQTLRPTYRLISGLPGSSNALAIAGRLGLPKDIIAKAKETAGTSALEIEEVLKQAEGARRALDRERTAAAIKRKEAEKIVDRYKKELEELDTKRTSAIGKVRNQARETLDKARSEVNHLLEELRVAIKETRDTKPGVQTELRKKSREVLRELDEMISQLPGMDEDKTAATDLPRLTSVKAGQNVMVVSLGHKGVALQDGIGKEEIAIQVGIMRVKAPVSDLVISAPKTSGPPPVLDKAPNIENELNLVGLRAEDAENRLTEYLTTAYDYRLREVRIVHGFGTGILRKMVRDILNHSPLVKSIRTGEPNEGGGGVTMAMLK